MPYQYVGSAETAKRVTITDSTIRDIFQRANATNLSNEMFIQQILNSSLNECLTPCISETSANIVQFFNQETQLHFPCLVIPVRENISNFSKKPYLVAFKPKPHAPVHILSYEHAKEEISKLILDTESPKVGYYRIKSDSQDKMTGNVFVYTEH